VIKLEKKKAYVYLGFKEGKLITILISTNSDRETAIDCDYYVDEPQDAKKQIETWLSKLEFP